MNKQEINIQDECIKIHSKFGMSEMANYKIQLLFETQLEEVERKYEEKLNKFNETIMKIVGQGDPYPLEDVLKGLMWATDYLLVKKSYDGYNYEELEQAVRRAKEIIAILETKEGHFL